MIIIENTLLISIVYVVVLALGLCVWKRVIEHIDHWLQEHLKEYEYEVVMWVTFGVMVFILIALGCAVFKSL